MKITSDNLNFKIITLKDKNKLQIFELSNFEYNNEQLAIILSQKTNFIEGNTTNLFDAQLMVDNKKTKGNYTLTETKEIKNIYKLYLSILTNKKFKLNLLNTHKFMYNDVIDVTFFPGKFKKTNNFTYLIEEGIKYKHEYLDFSLTLNYLKKNSSYLKQIQQLESKQDKFINLFLWHCNFEAIHPFPDGNGRIGRLILDKELINLNIQPLVLNQHIKKAYFELIKMAENKELNNDFLLKLNELMFNSKEILHESLSSTHKKSFSPNTNVDVFDF